MAEPALAGQQADHLGDEERVAVGLLVHRRCQLLGRLHPGDQGDEAGHLLLVKAAQQQPAAMLPASQVGQGRQAADVPGPLRCAGRCPRPAARRRAPAPGPRTAAGQRRRIRPVQVVQDQQQRRRAAAARRNPARLSNSRNRAASGSTGGGAGRSGRLSRTAGTTWAISAAPAPISRRSAAGSTGLDVGADELDPGPERGRALPLPAATPQHQGAACGRGAASSSASRVLPMPGSPATSTTPPRPAPAASRSAVSAASSASRPTNGVVTRPPPQARPCPRSGRTGRGRSAGGHCPAGRPSTIRQAPWPS